MIVDGKKIAKRLYAEVKEDVARLGKAPVLAAITCAPNFETQKYLELKKRKAGEVGITLRVIELPVTATTAEAIACVQAIVLDVDGIVVQLPFPLHIDREAVLAAVPTHKDPDGFSYGAAEGACLPPVVGAIQAIATEYQIDFIDQKVVVLGRGRLVGKPAAQYLEAQGAHVEVITEADDTKLAFLKEADILVTGIGKPHFVTNEMVHPGVKVFDAGTSEDGGVVAGDVHPSVSECSSLFTPVPGGIGPITVAVLLRNLIDLIHQYKR